MIFLEQFYQRVTRVKAAKIQGLSAVNFHLPSVGLDEGNQ
jgi:hypothetical protein